jgi:phosphinothricin acetyltransferase
LKDASERLIIRDATQDDAAAIADIYNESIRAGDATMVEQLQTAADIHVHMEAFSAREGYIVLERNHEILGWGVIKRFGEGPAYEYSGETSVFLRRNEVGKGYGTRIKRHLIERCKRYGYHHLVARIWASNTVSIEYNRNFGYEPVGILKEIGYIDGAWRDVALMQLVIR